MDKTVTIYSTPTCHFCQMTKEYFKEHNVAFTDFDVASDQAKRQEMIDKSGQMGVPVIFVGEEMIVGFDKKKFDSLFATSEAAPEATSETSPAV